MFPITNIKVAKLAKKSIAITSKSDSRLAKVSDDVILLDVLLALEDFINTAAICRELLVHYLEMSTGTFMSRLPAFSLHTQESKSVRYNEARVDAMYVSNEPGILFHNIALPDRPYT